MSRQTKVCIMSRRMCSPPAFCIVLNALLLRPLIKQLNIFGKLVVVFLEDTHYGKVEIADKTSVVIDKLVEDTSDISSPNTGDVTLVIVALAFVSAVAAGAILSIRKKGNC